MEWRNLIVDNFLSDTALDVAIEKRLTTIDWSTGLCPVSTSQYCKEDLLLEVTILNRTSFSFFSIATAKAKKCIYHLFERYFLPLL